MVAFLSCTFRFMVDRPRNPAHPTELITIGDHLRKTRIDRALYQSDVAKIIGVSNETINNWENNHSKPKVSHMKAIIAFLDYVPFECEKGTLGMRLNSARQMAGLSYRKLGNLINLDPQTISLIEQDKVEPFRKTIEKCESFISS